MKKNVLFLIVSVLIILVLILGIYFFTSSSNLNKCVKELNSKNLKAGIDYVPGEILVGFNETVTVEQAIELLKSKSLKVDESYEFFDELGFLVVKVEEGKEFEWICELQKNTQVQYAEINGITTVN